MSEDVNILVESPEHLARMDEARKRMRALYGENRKIEEATTTGPVPSGA